MHQALVFHLFRPNEESLPELCFAVGNLWRHIPSPPSLHSLGKEGWTRQRQINCTIFVTCCLAHSLSCPFICLCSHSPTSSLWFEKAKTFLLWWQRPHGAAWLVWSDWQRLVPAVQKFDTQMRTHTLRNLLHGPRGHLAIAQGKAGCS